LLVAGNLSFLDKSWSATSSRQTEVADGVGGQGADSSDARATGSWSNPRPATRARSQWPVHQHRWPCLQNLNVLTHAKGAGQTTYSASTQPRLVVNLEARPAGRCGCTTKAAVVAPWRPATGNVCACTPSRPGRNTCVPVLTREPKHHRRCLCVCGRAGIRCLRFRRTHPAGLSASLSWSLCSAEPGSRECVARPVTAGFLDQDRGHPGGTLAVEHRHAQCRAWDWNGVPAAQGWSVRPYIEAGLIFASGSHVDSSMPTWVCRRTTSGIRVRGRCAGARAFPIERQLSRRQPNDDMSHLRTGSTGRHIVSISATAPPISGSRDGRVVHGPPGNADFVAMPRFAGDRPMLRLRPMPTIWGLRPASGAQLSFRR
jgi:hypothetical protein